MHEIKYFSWKIYTVSKNFTRPPVVTVATNLISDPGENNDDDDEEDLGELGVVVPVAIVQVLSDDRVRTSRPIRVHLDISSNFQTRNPTKVTSGMLRSSRK